MQPDNRTLKMTIFLLAFLVIVMLFVFLFVIPSIKTYKSKRADYLQHLRLEKEIREKEALLRKKLEDVNASYATALHAFAKPFDEKAFLALASKYFSNSYLVPKSKHKSESGLQIYTFQADFDARTPVRFYQFVDALQQMGSVVKINFPIELESQGARINMRFNLSVYNLAYK